MALYANYHTHTVRCNHASGSEREYIEHAIKGGIKVLGFADHAPYPIHWDVIDAMRMPVEETPNYVSTLLALKKEYEKDIDIKIGYELEWFGDTHSLAMENICAYPVDFLILGQHFIGVKENWFYVGEPTTDPARLSAYVDTLTEAIGTGAFSYIAHPDILHFIGEPAQYQKEIHRLCTAAKTAGIPLEINLLGLCEDRWYPSDAFWEIARDTGVSIVFGFDAHRPEMLSSPGYATTGVEFAKKHGLTVSPNIPLLDPKNPIPRKTV